MKIPLLSLQSQISMNLLFLYLVTDINFQSFKNLYDYSDKMSGKCNPRTQL